MAAGIPADAVPRHRVDVRTRGFRGKVFVVSSVDAFELSDTAAFVFRAVDDTRTVAEIGALLAAEYDVPPAEAAADVADLIAELAGLLVLDVPAAA